MERIRRCARCADALLLPPKGPAREVFLKFENLQFTAVGDYGNSTIRKIQ